MNSNCSAVKLRWKSSFLIHPWKYFMIDVLNWDLLCFFVAVATHKFVICFCVGMELMSSKTRTPLFILYMITFSVMTPLGIGIGAALNAAKAEDQAYILATAILQGKYQGQAIKYDAPLSSFPFQALLLAPSSMWLCLKFWKRADLRKSLVYSNSSSSSLVSLSWCALTCLCEISAQ